MKDLFVLCISCLMASLSFAQTTYESPCVAEGKTFQVTIPDGLNKIDFLHFSKAVYTNTDAKGIYDPTLSDSDLVTLVIFYDDKDRSLDWYQEEVRKGSNGKYKDFKIVSEPEVHKVEDQDILFTSCQGKTSETEMKTLYFAMLRFGNRTAIFGYAAPSRLDGTMQFEEFIEMFNSFKKVETDKQDEFEAEQESLEEELRGYTGYQNDLFQTSIYHNEILPNNDEDWYTPFGENAHLLDEYSYKERNGFIYIFSGGKIDGYGDENEAKEKAIQLVLESSEKIKLKRKTHYSNDNYTFEVYRVSGLETVSMVYTMKLRGELLFFIIDEGENPASDFGTAAHDFILGLSFHSIEGDEIIGE